MTPSLESDLTGFNKRPEGQNGSQELPATWKLAGISPAVANSISDRIAAEYHLPLIASAYDMVEGSRIFHSPLSRSRFSDGDSIKKYESPTRQLRW
jgi:hypothetical protein